MTNPFTKARDEAAEAFDDQRHGSPFFGKLEYYKQGFKAGSDWSRKFTLDSAEVRGLVEALEQVKKHYIAEARQNDWVECCKLKELAREALAAFEKARGE